MKEWFEWFERFAQMEFVAWLSLMFLALSATIVVVLVEAQTITIREFLIRIFMGAFLAYLAGLYCLQERMSGRTMGVIVGIVTYQAKNILTGIGKLGMAFAKDPIALFQKIRKDGRK